MRLGKEKTKKDALAIIESELPIDPMTYTHFTKFLLWYGVKTSEMRTKPQIKHKYKTMR